MQAIQITETSRGKAICEKTPRFQIHFNGKWWGDPLYFNIKGYVGVLPCPNKDGTTGKLVIGERPISFYRKEIKNLNKEWKKFPR